VGGGCRRSRAVVDLLDRSIDERYALHAQILTTKRDLADLPSRVRTHLRARTRQTDGPASRHRHENTGQWLRDWLPSPP
jgi:hypothetical protein